MSHDESKSIGFPPLMAAVFAGAMLLLVAYSLFSAQWGTVSVGLVDVGSASGSATDFVPAQQNVLESVENERRALAKTRLLMLSQESEEVSALVADLEIEIRAWEAEILPLLENDSGKSLALNPDYVEVFRQIQSSTSRSDRGTPEHHRALLASIMEPVEKALADPSFAYSPSEQLITQLDSLKTSIQEAIKSYREPRQQIQSIVSTHLRNPVAAPGELTLRQTLEALAECEAMEQAQAIADAVAAERAKAQEEFAALEAEKARNEAARELARQRQEERNRQAEAERSLARQREDEQRRAAAAKIAEVHRRAADPAIQAKYKPFLAKGRFRFFPGGQRAYKPKGYRYPRPASFKRLRECGILRNIVVFLKTGKGSIGGRQTNYGNVIYYVDSDGFASQGYGNDRPTWSGYPNTEAQWRAATARFREFLELAPYWIKSGVLLP